MVKHKEKKEFELFGVKIPLDYILALGLIISVALYVNTNWFAFGVISLLLLLALFLKDALPSTMDSKGIKGSLYELGIALVAALAVWYGLGFILQTPTPIDVVTSCSMVPALERGDLIIIQGGEINAKELIIDQQINFQDFVRTDCILREKTTNISRKEQCTIGLKIDDEVQYFDKEGDIVVYEPKNALRDVGLVVHRVVMKLNFNGETFYLIKGDNNPGPDLFGISNDFAKREQIKGKTILRIPYIGYLKLFLSFQFEEPTNCKYNIEGG